METETSDRKGLTTATGPSNLVLWIIIIVCATIAFIALIIAAVALSRPATPSVVVQSAGDSVNAAAGSQTGSDVMSSTKTVGGVPIRHDFPGRIWTIAIGHDYGAHEYIDTSGVLAGFHHDLIAAVCGAAQMNCYTIWDPYSNCWMSEAGQRSSGGKGLHAKWYDACTGWSANIDRIGTFSFSNAFSPKSRSFFYTKPGSNFNALDIRNKKIGFLDGWSEDEKCVARQSAIQGKILAKNQIVYVTAIKDMLDIVTNGTVDALFAGDHSFDRHVAAGTLAKLTGSEFSCRLRGNSMMTRKDSAFIMHWNTGFQKIVSSGKFKKLCQRANDTHASDERGRVKCVDT
ncbi:uncharacterized protein LOC106169072 [Lingula anatina]|uniref:Uncharacterized protein LOC106169072 n=1 Tax=Lingula anatina TaxID=7574 RepID=A0A1S3J055_LINAN|nr:uncharacterized protein LOC106169072 [Lingula anatina]|eukprot:XP_013403832.1 uncharacterized protein LOC106169072 [Lingula anatina]